MNMGLKRVLSIWLPHLAIERWSRSSDLPPDSPIVLTCEGPHGPIIHAATKNAAERGARAGARLTDARALDPKLIAVPADPTGDAEAIKQFAKWAGRWSPLVELDGDGLRLDITGVAHLFRGERELIRDVQHRFAHIGFSTRVAIAPTAAAAWALSHYGQCASMIIEAEAEIDRRSGTRPQKSMFMDPHLGCSDELAEALAPLPAAALRLDDETVRTLERVGLKTIGALIGVPRLALARRFRGAANVVDALDRALGRKSEPLTAAPADLPPHAALRLEEPATHPDAASQALERLIPILVRELERRHCGARRLSLTGFRIDGSLATASVATTIPSREPKHLQRLLIDKAAGLDPEFGFDAFALRADWTENLGATQESLIDEPSAEQELARLVDRLTVKLGPCAVRRPQAEESHLPERASGWVSAVSSSRSSDRQGHPQGAERTKLHRQSLSKHLRRLPLEIRVCEEPKRPQRLLDRPEAIDVIYATPEGLPRRFMWRRTTHDIARVEGPERIAPEWWRQPSTTRLRDYYCVEDRQGRRYWIYREGLIGDGRGGAPGWFIHGLFG